MWSARLAKWGHAFTVGMVRVPGCDFSYPGNLDRGVQECLYYTHLCDFGRGVGVVETSTQTAPSSTSHRDKVAN